VSLRKDYSAQFDRARMLSQWSRSPVLLYMVRGQYGTRFSIIGSTVSPALLHLQKQNEVRMRSVGVGFHNGVQMTKEAVQLQNAKWMEQ